MFERKFYFLTILLLVVGCIQCQENILNCNFKTFEEVYRCEASRVIITGTSPLQITGNHLHGQSDGTVQHVVLSFAELHDFPAEILNRFVNLQVISFHSSMFKQLTPLQVQNCEHLFGLEFDQDQVESDFILSDGFFSSCPQLTNVQFKYTPIKQIDNRAFDILDKMTVLDLSRTTQRFIRQGTFSHLKELETLNFRGNVLRSVESHFFRKLYKLKNLSLRTNSITSLHSDAFVELESLENLDLSINSISVITIEHFRNQKQIKYINLSNNKLFSIQKGAFEQLLPSLTSLVVVSNPAINVNITNPDSNGLQAQLANSLKNFQENVVVCTYEIDFSGAYTCTIEYFEYNEHRNFAGITGRHLEGYSNDDVRTVKFLNSKISLFPTGIFVNLRNIETVYIDEVGLSEVEGLPCNSIRTFSAMHNNITALRQSSFRGCRLLSHIDLIENDIKQIEEGTFDQISWLFQVNLQNNSCINDSISASSKSGELLKQCYQNAKCGCGNLMGSIVLSIFFAVISILNK